MLFVQFLLAIALTVFMTACSVRPLPEDVTGFNTEQIVAKVRCEVRDGIRSYVLGALADPRLAPDFPQYTALVEDLEAHPEKWRILNRLLDQAGLDPTTKRVFDRYRIGAIAYEFLFNITESNKHDTGFDFVSNVSHGLFTAGVTGNNTLMRNNTRTLRVSDNFEDLITLFGSDYCGPGGDSVTRPIDRQVPNMLYPVAGELGLQELVGSFLNLNQSGNLIGPKSETGAAALLPTIEDDMQFTTSFSGGGSLGYTGNNDGRRSLRLSKASISTDNTRSDIHTLRIVIKLPAATDKRTRTIAEQRLLAAGVPLSTQASVKQLVKDVTVLDLREVPLKTYLEEKIIVARNLRILLPD